MRTRNLLLLTAFLFGSGLLSGCGMLSSAIENVTGLVGLGRTGTIINKAWIRSSYAVVAADLLEVKRGESLDILDEIDFEKVHWYRVRARDEVNTEGWIEAQNVITEDLLEKSKKLAEEDKDIPQQAIAQLRAPTNLRLSPEQTDDNILFKLDNQTNEKPVSFEVVSWKYVQKTQEAVENDDAKRGEQKLTRRAAKNAELEAAREANEPEKMDEKYDIWYKVRLDRSVSPAPAGWLFGRQVELQLPNDIVFYQNNNKKFIAWQRLDNIESNEKIIPGDTGIAKVSKPGSWVILSRSNLVKTRDGIEPDFDGILVLAYDKYNEEYYTAFRSGDVWGLLPLKVEGTGDNKTFTVKLHNAENQLAEYRFVAFKDKNRIKVTAPPDIPKPSDK